MRVPVTLVRRFTLASVVAAAVAVALPSPALRAQAPAVDALQAQDGSDDRLVVRHRGRDASVRLAVADGPGLRVGPPAATPAARALGMVTQHGRALGLPSGGSAVALRTTPQDARGHAVVRLQQTVDGIPVTGSHLNVHVRGDRVTKVAAELLDDRPATTTPTVAPDQATGTARALVGRARGGNLAGITFSAPRLEVLNTRLLDDQPAATRLAWFVEATGFDVREFIWIDATSGERILAFSQLTDARNRATYNTFSTNTLPGTLVLSEPSSPTSPDVDATRAHVYAGHAYDYFLVQHGRDSFDGAGATIKSTVDYCEAGVPCPYEGAFWNGSQLVYGDGYSVADDVIGHEFAHAVTDYSSGLFYYGQSGALNESMSDIFGETIDLGNGSGTDSAAMRWRMGEDLPGGAIRHMMTPNLFSQPAHIGDPLYVCDPAMDSAGVHINSGVPNHAYALLVDGGTHGGQTVNGIGTGKAGRIFYRTLTQYLGSGSNFADLAAALPEACGDLIGTNGITTADCSQVVKAVTAVNMGAAPSCGLAPMTRMCPIGQTPKIALDVPFTSGGVAPFSPQLVSQATQVWGSVTNAYTRDGFGALGQDPAVKGDSALVSGQFQVPAGGRAQIEHAWNFDFDGSGNWDGGVIEYSVNGGPWTNASSLVIAGQGYNGTLFSAPYNDNVLAGQAAFVNASLGFTSTQVNLSTLAGQAVRLRFRIGTDSAFGNDGWVIDSFKTYTCASQTPGNFLTSGTTAQRAVLRASAGTLNWLVEGGASVALGTPTDMPVPADYNGDGSTEMATFNAGVWKFASGASVVFGAPGDLPVPADFDGDGRADKAVYRPTTGQWFIEGQSTRVLGVFGDIPVPADYDGDGMAEPAVFRPNTGTWYVFNDFVITSTVFGLPGDIPVPADYNGDARAEFGVFRPSNATWYTSSGTAVSWGQGSDLPVALNMIGDAHAEFVAFRPSTGQWFAYNLGGGTASSVYGAAGDMPAMLRPYILPRPAFDNDGDRKADATVWRPATGSWYRTKSASNYAALPASGFGLATDISMPSDFDGDGRLDIAVFRPSTAVWYLKYSSTNFTTGLTKAFGLTTDIPVIADFDGDRRTDIGVFRPSSGTWYTLLSTTNFASGSTRSWGSPGDVPKPADMDGDGRADLVVFRPATGGWFVSFSSTNFTTSLARTFGLATDRPLVADLTGDRRSEIIVYRPSTGAWYWLTSGSNHQTSVSVVWGTSADMPVPSDYNGDGTAEIAVYRPASGTWYVKSGPTLVWGASGDVPAPRQ